MCIFMSDCIMHPVLCVFEYLMSVCVSLYADVYACLCTCIRAVDKPHMRPLRHKGGNICIEGPLCPNLMEIQSSSLSPCSLVMPAAKPQMDHYVPAEWEGQETSDGNWNGGRDTLIQLRPSDTRSNRICSFHEVHTKKNTPRRCAHPPLKAKYAHIQIGWTHMHHAGYACMINCLGFKCRLYTQAGAHTHTHTYGHTYL